MVMRNAGQPQWIRDQGRGQGAWGLGSGPQGYCYGLQGGTNNQVLWKH